MGRRLQDIARKNLVVVPRVALVCEITRRPFTAFMFLLSRAPIAQIWPAAAIFLSVE